MGIGLRKVLQAEAQIDKLHANQPHVLKAAAKWHSLPRKKSLEGEGG